MTSIPRMGEKEIDDTVFILARVIHKIFLMNRTFFIRLFDMCQSSCLIFGLKIPIELMLMY